jgi:predicted nucleic acid-binding protein
LEQAQDEVGRFFSFRVSTTSSRLLHRRALIVADQYNIPSAYDAHYVALAELAGAILWTNHERLLRLLAGKLPFVRWIADYRA